MNFLAKCWEFVLSKLSVSISERGTHSGGGRQGRPSGTDAGQREVCQSCRYAPALGAQWESFLSPTCLEPLAQDWWAAGGLATY